jgi:hypothetical protein
MLIANDLTDQLNFNPTIHPRPSAIPRQRRASLPFRQCDARAVAERETEVPGCSAKLPHSFSHRTIEFHNVNADNTEHRACSFERHSPLDKF